jgi:hypothetical protein
LPFNTNWIQFLFPSYKIIELRMIELRWQRVGSAIGRRSLPQHLRRRQRPSAAGTTIEGIDALGWGHAKPRRSDRQQVRLDLRARTATTNGYGRNRTTEVSRQPDLRSGQAALYATDAQLENVSAGSNRRPRTRQTYFRISSRCNSSRYFSGLCSFT